MADIPLRSHPTVQRLGALGAAGALLALTACAASASVESAPYAQDPACAEVMLTLPEEIGDFSQRSTTSQATAVWGDPSAVVLRCGVEPIGPTDDPCVAPAGVDWVWIDHEDHVQLISFGREPSVEVLLDGDQLSEDTTMNAQFALSEPVSRIEQTRECTGLSDSLEVPDEDPAGN